MSISLLNLDDRRWPDLVEEGRALIPFYSPDWTDHNLHDPGITFVELFAWLAEMDIYQVNRIPESHLRKFLALVGVIPEPPRPAQTVLSLQTNDDQPVLLPATLEFEGEDSFGQPARFRILNDLAVSRAELQAIQRRDRYGFHDLTGRWRRGEIVEIFGADPEIGAEFYLGFDRALSQDVALSLFFTLFDLPAGTAERARLMDERRLRAETCCTPSAPLTCDQMGAQRRVDKPEGRPPLRLTHHSVRLIWEFHTSGNRWDALQIERGEVADETRALTLNGRVLIKPSTHMAAGQIGQVKQSLYYLRVRIAAGSYDAPPSLYHLDANALLAEQATPDSANALGWIIAANATVEGRPPATGQSARFQFRLNDRGEISHLAFVEDQEDPELRVLEFVLNTASAPGRFSVEAVLLGRGDGKPNQRLPLQEKPVLQPGFQLYSIEEGKWQKWELRSDFDSSRRSDAHFLLDPTEGLINFGNGERGRVVPAGALIIARYDTTRAGAGNLLARQITRLADTPHNRAVLQLPLGASGTAQFEAFRTRLMRIDNPLPAKGGAAAETLTHAIGRAIESVDKTQRAVTLGDYQALALQTAGARLARAEARANLHPGFSCLNAQGVITVLVLPYLPIDRPAPSRELLRLVTDYLSRRRVIGTRVMVAGPSYLELAVHAKVVACTGTNKAELQQRIAASLDRFFHPLTGGPAGTGWPFGRDVFRSEVLQVIDETAGVDHVLFLELIGSDGLPQCGNVCLAPMELVAAGEHQIDVV
jgi:baseplate J-like protein